MQGSGRPGKRGGGCGDGDRRSGDRGPSGMLTCASARPSRSTSCAHDARDGSCTSGDAPSPQPASTGTCSGGRSLLALERLPPHCLRTALPGLSGRSRAPRAGKRWNAAQRGGLALYPSPLPAVPMGKEEQASLGVWGEGLQWADSTPSAGGNPSPPSSQSPALSSGTFTTARSGN